MSERLLDEVRGFLRENPGASRRQLTEGVSGSVRDVTAAFEALVERGEAEYVKPEGRGKAGRCVLRATPDIAPMGDTDLLVPSVRCPGCKRTPPIRYTRRETIRARKERQSARLQSVVCPHCATFYWIQARHVAHATLDNELRAA